MEPHSHQAAGIEIGDLADFDLTALRQHRRSLYRSEPPVRMSRELLMQAVVYRLQEQRHGGLSRAMRLKLVEAGKHGTGGKSNARSKSISPASFISGSPAADNDVWRRSRSENSRCSAITSLNPAMAPLNHAASDLGQFLTVPICRKRWKVKEQTLKQRHLLNQREAA